MFGGLFRRMRGALDVVQQYYAPATGDSATNVSSSTPPDSDLNSLLENLLLLKDLSVAETAASETNLIEKLKVSLASGAWKADQLLGGNYTALQHAVAVNSERLVAWLIDEAGADVNGAGSPCSSPLHLACKLGHVTICAALLQRGARVNSAAAVCYPFPHSGRTACHRLMLPRVLLLGMSAPRDCPAEDRRLAVHHAIVADNADLLALFLEPARRVWIPLYPLQRLFSEACRLGSLRCVSLLVQTFRVVEDLGSSTHISLVPDGVVDDAEPVLQLNQVDEDGFSPFMYGVARSVDLTRLLIDHGANVCKLSAHGDTALHLLFKNLASPPLGVAERARLLLGSGLEPQVNLQDREQCTALHRLVHHINNNVRYLSLTDTTDPETIVAPSVPEQQEAYQNEIIECLELLLSHNSNPSLTNWQGLTPFHLLFRAFSSFLSHDVDPNFLDIHHYFYIFDMDVFARAIELFLHHGSDPNERAPDGQLPLKVMLHGILNISPVQYFKFRPGYLQCLKCLCAYGADCNFLLQNHQGTCVSLVAALAESVINTVGVGFYAYDRSAKEANAQFIDDILRCLLRFGLDANHTSKRRRGSMELGGDGSGNALAEFVNLAGMIAETQDLRFLQQWLLTLLQFGADPDREPYPAEATICHSQSSIFLRQVRTQPINQLLHLLRGARANRLATSPHGQRLLLLLFNVTSHEPLYSALHAFLVRLQRELPIAGEQNIGPLVRLLTPLVTNPRSLKQMARVAVYRGINRQIRARVSQPQLDIPRELVQYLYDVELS